MPARRLPGTGPGGLSSMNVVSGGFETLSQPLQPVMRGRAPSAEVAEQIAPPAMETSVVAAVAAAGVSLAMARPERVEGATAHPVPETDEAAATLTAVSSDGGAAPAAELAISGGDADVVIELDKVEGEAPAVAGAIATGTEGAVAATAPEPEDAPPEPSPEQAVGPATAAVGRRAAQSATHQPAGMAAGGAVAASNRPEVTAARAGEGSSLAAADSAETGDIDPAAFKRDLQAAITAAMPQPRSEAQARDVIANGGDRAAAQLEQNMGQRQAEAVGQLPASVEAEPVPDPAAGGTEVALVPEEPGPPPEGVSAAPVVPPQSTPQAIDTSPNRENVDAIQAQNNITRERMERGNDEQFSAMLGAQDEAEAHDVTAPQELRAAEAADRQATGERAQASISGGLTDFHGNRVERLGNVARQQTDTKGLTETRKQEITDEIAEIARKTREDVTAILDAMDAKVAEDFGAAIERALAAYEAAFDDEQGGVLTAIGDVVTGEWGDERLNRALAYGRNAFDREISSAIDQIAVYVTNQLKAARDRVKKGRDDVDLYLTQKVSDAEREFAEGASTSITADFDNLEGEISARKDALVNRMVDMYRQGIERRNQREQELRDANKSFWQLVCDATVGVIEKIIEFKNMLMGVLSRAAGVIDAILEDPIGFLENLIAGIGAGLERFAANIEANLQQALMSWLFGALEGAGLKLPERFDLAGILDLALQILGLTKENVRRRAVMILGEDVVSKIETAVDFLHTLFTEGPAALWEMLLDQLGSVKDMILDEIKSWVVTEIIEAGIKWLIGLLNPAAAFVKACMMIYDILIFFIERGQQIIEAVNAIIDSLAAIVAGSIGAMAQKVEQALNGILPVVIGFLASLLGLGGISDTIRGIIEKIQEPVNRAIDWVINLGLKAAKAIMGFFGGDKEDSAEPDEDGDDVKVEAAKRMQARLGEDSTPDEAKTAAATVLGELQPLGLKRLLVRETEDGEAFVMAEASPQDDILQLAKDEAIVVLTAQITVSGEAEPTAGIERLVAFHEPSPRQQAVIGSRQIAELPPAKIGRMPARDPRGYRQSGGIIIAPEEGAKTFDIVSWNTGGRVQGSNVSHAERQLADWYGDEFRWRQRVAEVSISLSHSPCGECIPYLLSVIDLTPKAAHGKCRITWQELHRGAHATTAADIRALEARQWTCVGPRPKGSEATSGEAPLRVIRRPKRGS